MKKEKEKLNILTLHRKVALGLSIITMLGTATPAYAFTPANSETIKKVEAEAKKILEDENLLKHLMGTRFVKHAEGMQYDLAINKDNAHYIDGQMYTRDGMRIPAGLLSETSWYDIFYETARRRLAKTSMEENVVKNYILEIQNLYSKHGYIGPNKLKTDGEYTLPCTFVDAQGQEIPGIKELFKEMSITKWGNDLDLDFIIDKTKAQKLISLSLDPFKDTLKIPVTFGNTENPKDVENANAMSISIPAEFDSSKIHGSLKYVGYDGKEKETNEFYLKVDYNTATRTGDLNKLYYERTKARLDYWIICGEYAAKYLPKDNALKTQIESNLIKLREMKNEDKPDLSKILDLSIPTYKAESLTALKTLLYNKLTTHRNLFLDGSISEKKYTKGSIEKYKEYLNKLEKDVDDYKLTIPELVTKIAELDFSMNNGVLKYNTKELEDLIKKVQKQNNFKQYYTDKSWENLVNVVVSAKKWIEDNKNYTPQEDETSTHIANIKKAFKELKVNPGQTLPDEAKDLKDVEVSFDDTNLNKMLVKEAKDDGNNYIISFKEDSDGNFVNEVSYNTFDGQTKKAQVLESENVDSLKGGVKVKKVSLPKDYDTASGLRIKYYSNTEYCSKTQDKVKLNVKEVVKRTKDPYKVNIKFDKQFNNVDTSIANEMIKNAIYDPDNKVLTLEVENVSENNYVKQIQFTGIKDSFAKGKEFIDSENKIAKKFDVNVDIDEFTELKIQQFDVIYNGEKKSFDAELKLVFSGKAEKNNEEEVNKALAKINPKLTKFDENFKKVKYLLSDKKVSDIGFAKTFAEEWIKAKDPDMIGVAEENLDSKLLVLDSYIKLHEEVERVKGELNALSTSDYEEASITEAKKKVSDIIAGFKDGSLFDINAGIKNLNEAKDLLKKKGTFTKEDLAAKIKKAEELLESSKKEEQTNNKLQAAIDAAKEKLNGKREEDELTNAVKALDAAIEAFNQAEDKKKKDPKQDDNAITVNVQFLEQSQNRTSMADAALWSKAKVTQDSNGKYWIEIKMVPMQNKQDNLSGAVTDIKVRPFSGGMVDSEKSGYYDIALLGRGVKKSYPGRFKMPLDMKGQNPSNILLVMFTYDAVVNGQITEMQHGARLVIDTNSNNWIQGFNEHEFEVDKKGLTRGIYAAEWYLKQPKTPQSVKDKINKILPEARKIEKDPQATQDNINEYSDKLYEVNKLPELIQDILGKISFAESNLTSDRQSGQWSKKSLDAIEKVINEAKQAIDSAEDEATLKEIAKRVDSIDSMRRFNTVILENEIKEAKERIKDESKFEENSLQAVKNAIKAAEEAISHHEQEGLTTGNGFIAQHTTKISRALDGLKDKNESDKQKCIKHIQVMVAIGNGIFEGKSKKSEQVKLEFVDATHKLILRFHKAGQESNYLEFKEIIKLVDAAVEKYNAAPDNEEKVERKANTKIEKDSNSQISDGLVIGASSEFEITNVNNEKEEYRIIELKPIAKTSRSAGAIEQVEEAVTDVDYKYENDWKDSIVLSSKKVSIGGSEYTTPLTVAVKVAKDQKEIPLQLKVQKGNTRFENQGVTVKLEESTKPEDKQEKVYTVPFKWMKVNGKVNDPNGYAMADGVFVRPMQIVEKDGQSKLRIRLKDLTEGVIYVTELSIYEDGKKEPTKLTPTKTANTNDGNTKPTEFEIPLKDTQDLTKPFRIKVQIAATVMPGKPDAEILVYPNHKYEGKKTNNYKITFSTEHGNAPSILEIKEMEIPIPPKDFEKDVKKVVKENKEYLFKGWLKADGSEFNFDEPITENITLTAKWEEKVVTPKVTKYKVKFVTDKGTAPTEAEVEENHNVTRPSNFTEDATKVTVDNQIYIFKGWYDNDTKFDFSTKITSDKTLTAKWNKAYTVKFKDNMTTDVVSDQVVEENAKATEPSNLIKDETAIKKENKDYVFKGWKYEGNFFDFKNTNIVKDLELTAYWEEKVSVDTKRLQSKIAEARKLLTDYPNKEESAKGKLQEAIGQAEIALNSQTQEKVTDAIAKLNAAMETYKSSPDKQKPAPKVEFTVRLKAGEGKGADIVVKVAKGNKYILPINTFTAPDGKEFAGWKIGNESEIKQPNESVEITANTEITATWKVKAPKEVDKSELNSAITNAENALEAGTKKTNAAKEALQAAIDAAKVVRDNKSATKEDVDSAKGTLEKAIATFNESADKVELSKDALNQMITNAENALANGTDKPQSAKDALKAAINTAKTILNNATEQSQLDNQLTDLTNALTAFNKATEEKKVKEYSVPVKILERNKQNDSMADKAIYSSAKITVDGDKVKISVTFHPIEITLPGMTTPFKGQVTNFFLGEGSGKQELQAEVNGENKTYTWTVDKSYLTSEQKIVVSFWVDAMDSIAGGGPGSGEKSADLVIYGDKLDPKYEEDKPSSQVDKTELQSLINECTAIDLANKTDETKTNFINELAKANRVNTDASATTEQVNGAITSLRSAKDALRDKGNTPAPKVVDKEALKSLIKEVERIDLTKYTNESAAAVRIALTNANTIKDKSDATEAQVTKAITELRNAKNNLILKIDRKDELKRDLRNLIDDCESIRFSDYTDSSVDRLKDAIRDAKAILNSSISTERDLENAISNLKNKRYDLVLKNKDVVKVYRVPVSAKSAYGNGTSMADAALTHTAIVREENGRFVYTVQFNPIERQFNGQTLKGKLTNLFIYDGGKNRASSGSNGTWSWQMNGKYNSVRAAVWVDAMDSLKGGTPGAGEQDVILEFNWAGASVTEVESNKREDYFGSTSLRRDNSTTNKKAEESKKKAEEKKNETNKKIDNTKVDPRNFTDIKTHWAKSAIEYVVNKGYFAGTSANTFTPNRAITRGEFVTVLGRMLNIDKSKFSSNKFSDVKSTDFYAPYVAWAESVGITKGIGNSKFAPNKKLTREEMAVMMIKFLEISNKNFNKSETKEFKVAANISSWAKDAVKEMSDKGIVNGMENGNFAPKQAFTRAQVAQVLYNIDHK